MSARDKRSVSFVERHGLWSDEQAKAAEAVEQTIAGEELESVRFSFVDQHGILRGKTMVAGRFDPGFKVALHHKDLAICRAMGGPPLPIVDLTLENYQRLIDRGYGAEDISALYRIKRGQLGAA